MTFGKKIKRVKVVAENIIAVARESVNEFMEEIERQDIAFSIKNGDVFWKGGAEKAEFLFMSIADYSRANSVLRRL